MSIEEANNAYLDRIGIQTPAKRTRMLDAMRTYGENRWWEAEQLEPIAFWQIQEKVLLVQWHDFIRALDKLLQRPVFTHELPTEALLDEVKSAWFQQL